MAHALEERPSWNPLRCSGTSMAPNVLLAAKLIALCLIATNEQAGFAARTPLDVVLKGVFFGAAVALLLNRSVRYTAMLLGGSLLLSALADPSYDSYATVFCGAFLALAGFASPSREPWLPRRLTALAYLGLALVTWRQTTVSGALEFIGPAIAAVVGAGFFFRRTWPFAIWLGIVFHAASMWLAPAPALSYSLLASYLVFAPWPKEELTILYDGDCGFCETTRRFFERLDFDRIYDWHPFQDGTGDKWGIPREALERAAHVVANGKIYAGFRAFQALTLYSPLTYFVLAALLLSARAFLPNAQPAIAALAIALYFPLVRPLGEAVYQLIARNRHRLPGEKTCKIA